MSLELINDRVHFPHKERLKIVIAKIDPMVSHPVLGKIISPDSLASIP